MKLASCYPTDAWNFKVVPRFLENMCTPANDCSQSAHFIDIYLDYNCKMEQITMTYLTYYNMIMGCVADVFAGMQSQNDL